MLRCCLSKGAHLGKPQGVLGIWSGEGMGKGGGRGGQFTSNLRPRWTDPVTERRVSKKVKGTKKGEKRGSARGVKKQGNCAIYIVTCICVYKCCRCK